MTFKNTVTPIIAALTLCGCTTFEAKPNDQVEYTETSEFCNAVIHTVAGEETDPDLGCEISEKARATIQATLEQEYAALEAVLADSNIELEKRSASIRMVFAGGDTFQIGSDDLNPDLKPLLESITEIMLNYPATLIEVAGFTSNTGPQQLNFKISEKRAKKIADYIIKQGFDDDRIFIVGYGPLSPIADNDTQEGRNKNRRIEITIKPINISD